MNTAFLQSFLFSKYRWSYNDWHAKTDLQCNPLAWPDKINRPNSPTNFALGSASSQLQEVLVTDLPRSFNRGERETREGGGKERERGREGERERERARVTEEDESERGEEEGESRGQVFQLSLQHLSDPSGSDCVLSKKRNKNITYCTYWLCSLWVLLPLCPLISLYTFPLRCWQERLQKPISHSCDLHPLLGPVSGVKVGRAKATCILHTGTQLTPPLLAAHTAFSDSVHM